MEHEMVNPEKVEITDRKVAYNGFLTLEHYQLKHQCYDGSWSKTLHRELILRDRSAAVLPYDPVNDCVVLIEQFRVGAMSLAAGPWLWENIAGMLDAGESAETCVRREALEEAGCHILELMPVHEFLLCPGMSSEVTHLFLGRIESDYKGGFYGCSDEGEDIRAEIYSFDSVMAMMAAGKIVSVVTLLALQWLQINHQRIRMQWSD